MVGSRSGERGTAREIQSESLPSIPGEVTLSRNPQHCLFFLSKAVLEDKKTIVLPPTKIIPHP